MNKKFFVTVISLFIAGSVFAENITFSANSMKGTMGSNSDATELNGNAYVLTETMEISAASIKMSGDNFRYIEAVGNVKGKNLESKMEFVCGNLRYDRETKIAELRNDVTLEDSPNDVSAKAQMIEYNQDTEVAVMQIDIELKQKDNICSGAYAIYRKNEKMLELSGNAQIKQKEDTFRAQEISLNMDTQEISLDGRVKGSIIDDGKSKTESEDETEEVKAETKNNSPEEKPAEAKTGELSKKEEKPLKDEESKSAEKSEKVEKNEKNESKS